MSDEMMFTNGEGFKEYAESLSPEERDNTVVMTTVTAIRSLEIDLAIAVAEVDRLRAALNQTTHYLILNDDGWSLEHLVSCRLEMTNCDFHMEVADKSDYYQSLFGSGRFPVVFGIDGELTTPSVLDESY